MNSDDVMALKYTKKVMDHFLHPRNMGELKDADVEATDGSPACGDMMTIGLKIDPKTHKILDVKFKSYGCASNIATASVITEMVKGRTLEEAKKIKWNAAAEELDGLPPVKMHCSVLAAKTLMDAIRKYEKMHGLLEGGEEELSAENIRLELRNIINPEMGIDIVRLKMVKGISVKKGVVKIRISMGNTDRVYEDSIREEIEEHVKAMRGVKRVEVGFST